MDCLIDEIVKKEDAAAAAAAGGADAGAGGEGLLLLGGLRDVEFDSSDNDDGSLRAESLTDDDDDDDDDSNDDGSNNDNDGLPNCLFAAKANAARLTRERDAAMMESQNRLLEVFKLKQQLLEKEQEIMSLASNRHGDELTYNRITGTAVTIETDSDNESGCTSRGKDGQDGMPMHQGAEKPSSLLQQLNLTKEQTQASDTATETDSDNDGQDGMPMHQGAEKPSSLLQQLNLIKEQTQASDTATETDSDNENDCSSSGKAGAPMQGAVGKSSSLPCQLNLIKERTSQLLPGGVTALKGENVRLDAEKLRLAKHFNECMQIIDSLADKLHEADPATQRLGDENERVLTELGRLSVELNICHEEMVNLSTDLSEAHLQLEDATQDKEKVDEATEENGRLECELLELRKAHRQLEATKRQDEKHAMQEVAGLKDENESAMREQGHLKEKLNTYHQSNDELSKDNKAKVDELKEENEVLRVGQLRLTNDYNECMKNMGGLSSELAAALWQLEHTEQPEDTKEMQQRGDEVEEECFSAATTDLLTQDQSLIIRFKQPVHDDSSSSSFEDFLPNHVMPSEGGMICQEVSSAGHGELKLEGAIGANHTDINNNSANHGTATVMIGKSLTSPAPKKKFSKLVRLLSTRSDNKSRRNKN